jgi:hypothetical protein
VLDPQGARLLVFDDLQAEILSYPWLKKSRQVRRPAMRTRMLLFFSVRSDILPYGVSSNAFRRKAREPENETIIVSRERVVDRRDVETHLPIQTEPTAHTRDKTFSMRYAPKFSKYVTQNKE